MIPRDAPEGWYPRNCLQAEYRAPGVTVVDARGGVERLFVPPLGAGASDGVRGGNLMIERDASLERGVLLLKQERRQRAVRLRYGQLRQPVDDRDGREKHEFSQPAAQGAALDWQLVR